MNSLHKDTFFSSQKSVNCGGRLLSLDKPAVMGIVNITPDSFYDGGKYKSIGAILKHVGKIVEEGAVIIDIGAVSTKPDAVEVDLNEEKTRLIHVVKSIVKEFPGVILSVDTFRSEIAKAAVSEGVQIINDISAGQFDDKMFVTVASLQVPYIIMHIQGTPATMQKEPKYINVTKEVMLYLSERVNKLRQLGVNDIIIDPGFGFGKTIEHNFEILKNLDLFSSFELPILVGLSRKSMISKTLGIHAGSALNGTTVLNTMALMKGANILRVHDVKEAVEAVSLYSALNS